MCIVFVVFLQISVEGGGACPERTRDRIQRRAGKIREREQETAKNGGKVSKYNFFIKTLYVIF